MMKKQLLNGFKLAIFCAIFSSASFAQNATQSAKLPGKIALHIAKMHYEHPVRLLHPYLDFWHMKGPMAEKVAQAALQKRFAEANNCEAGGNVVLQLEPHLFYNPQLRVFHAEFIAQAFTQTGAPITRIKKQAEQIGDLTLKPEMYMQKAYEKAMQKIIRQLEIDKAFLATLDQPMIANTQAICYDIDTKPVSKIYY